MALIKIRGRKDPIEIDREKGIKIKTLRFGDVNGRGKADSKDDLVIGDEWAGTVGLVEWVELGKKAEPAKFRLIRVPGENSKVFKVPKDYQLKDGEEFA